MTTLLTTVLCVLIVSISALAVILNRNKRKQLKDENRIIINSVPAMIWFKDRNNRILRCNTLAAQTMGLSVAAMEGHLTTEFYPDEAGKYFSDDLEVINSGSPKLGIVELLSVQETKVWVRTDKVPYRNLKGEIIGVIVFAIEISHEKLIEERISKLADELRRAVALRDEFMSIASHELKTPLTSLTMQLQYLTQVSVSPEKLNSIVNKALIQVHRLASLISDMMDVSRISGGQLALKIEEVDLGQLIDDVLKQYAEQLQEAGCICEVCISQSAIGHWDRFRIEQVLINLLTNAMKYGRGKPISISVVRVGDVARLVVKDSGVGIPLQDRERIFERFERAAPQGVSGLGLGLYIVRQILSKHGGTVHVESERDLGSSFIVELPLRCSSR